MQPFLHVAGPAVSLPLANIDTDVIMPKQFLKGIDRAGLDRGALLDLRFDPAGVPRPDFAMNQPAWRDARLPGDRFQFRLRLVTRTCRLGAAATGHPAVLGTSFAGIFADNAANNGLLLVTLPSDAVAALAERAADPGRNTMAVDLEASEVEAAGMRVGFTMDASRRAALLQGLDAIGATLLHAAAIRAFQDAHLAANPWLQAA